MNILSSACATLLLDMRAGRFTDYAHWRRKIVCVFKCNGHDVLTRPALPDVRAATVACRLRV